MQSTIRAPDTVCRAAAEAADGGVARRTWQLIGHDARASAYAVIQQF